MSPSCSFPLHALHYWASGTSIIWTAGNTGVGVWPIGAGGMVSRAFLWARLDGLILCFTNSQYLPFTTDATLFYSPNKTTNL